MSNSKTILAAVVLHRRSAAESQAFVSLTSLLSSHGAANLAIEVILFDNSPDTQPRPTGHIGEYVANPANPGLAWCYNVALKMAQDKGIPWLLLLDQDTTLTGEYLDELLSTLSKIGFSEDVVAVVPRLSDRGVLCSPIYPPSYGSPKRFAPEVTGVVAERLHAFNSGAAVRVSAIAGIGGFPSSFPLDYLDHATFAALQNAGGKLYVLGARLEHELSSNQEGWQTESSPYRQQGILDAEYRFYRLYGTPGDRIRRRVRLLKACVGRLMRGKDKGQTRRMFLAAIRP